jgi:hypothetical protein
MVLTLGFGLWLVHDAGYGWGQTWIVGAPCYGCCRNAMGGILAATARSRCELAERLTAEGDVPSPELSRASRPGLARPELG